MDPLSLIAAALAAGATEGISDAANAAIADLYQRVKARLGGRPRADLVLVEHEQAPAEWRAPLSQMLRDSDAGNDPQLLALAERVMALVDPVGTGRGRYLISMPDARGVQLGDRNTQTNTFGD